jgi:hypothetical protein
MRRRCKSAHRCNGFTTTADDWCPKCRALLDEIFYQLHPKQRPKADPTIKAGWTSKNILPSKPARGEVGPAYQQAILNALAKGAHNGAALAAAVNVPANNRSFLRARSALAKDGKIAREGRTWTLAAEASAAA